MFVLVPPKEREEGKEGRNIIVWIYRYLRTHKLTRCLLVPTRVRSLLLHCWDYCYLDYCWTLTAEEDLGLKEREGERAHEWLISISSLPTIYRVYSWWWSSILWTIIKINKTDQSFLSSIQFNTNSSLANTSTQRSALLLYQIIIKFLFGLLVIALDH